jgi:probable phosphoglycerate mutase
MKRIYFVRHGQTAINALPLTHSSPENPLNEKGHAQAEFIAERCSKLPIEALISSPYERARQTAGHIKEKTGLTPVESDLFGECRFISSYFDKTRTEESEAALAEIIAHWGEDFHVADEENFADIFMRARKALDFLVARPEQNIGVVTHGLFLRQLVGVGLFGENYTPEISNVFLKSLDTINTGLTVMQYDENNSKHPWMLWVWNDHAHLG